MTDPEDMTPDYRDLEASKPKDYDTGEGWDMEDRCDYPD